MDKLILNDNIEFIGGSAVKEGWSNKLRCIVLDKDIVSITNIFGNKENIKTITYINGIVKIIYSGYTNIDSIGFNYNNTGIELLLTGSNPSVKKEYTVPKEYLPEEMR